GWPAAPPNRPGRPTGCTQRLRPGVGTDDISRAAAGGANAHRARGVRWTNPKGRHRLQPRGGTNAGRSPGGRVVRGKAAAKAASAAPARLEFEIRIDRTAKGKKQVQPVPAQEPDPVALVPTAVPDVARTTQLLVVAYWFERLIAEG